MYEKFTAAARTVLHLAKQEAMRLQHQYLGTEHLLLGLITEESGIALAVLRNFRLQPARIRHEVELFVPGPTETMAGPGLAPQTPRAKKVIEHAIDEANSVGHCHVGTDHLLLGLLRENAGRAASVLRHLGLELENAREEVQSVWANPSLLPGETTEGTLLPKVEPGERPAEIARLLDRQLELLQYEKEWCVAKQLWDQAATISDFQELFKKLRADFALKWPKVS